MTAIAAVRKELFSVNTASSLLDSLVFAPSTLQPGQIPHAISRVHSFVHHVPAPQSLFPTLSLHFICPPDVRHLVPDDRGQDVAVQRPTFQSPLQDLAVTRPVDNSATFRNEGRLMWREVHYWPDRILAIAIRASSRTRY